MIKRLLVCCALISITACAIDPYTGEEKVSNTAIGAGVGAAAGAAIGAAVDGGDGAWKGAIAGAAAGTGVGYYKGPTRKNTSIEIRAHAVCEFKEKEITSAW